MTLSFSLILTVVRQHSRFKTEHVKHKNVDSTKQYQMIAILNRFFCKFIPKLSVDISYLLIIIHLSFFRVKLLTFKQVFFAYNIIFLIIYIFHGARILRRTVNLISCKTHWINLVLSIFDIILLIILVKLFVN